MVERPDIWTDFAGWTAHNWSNLVPDADAAAALVAIRFIRIADDLSKSHNDTIQPWKKRGISTIADFRILGLLRHLDGEGMTTQRIADCFGFDPSTASSRLSRLEKHDHIKRIEHPTNRRKHLIVLNPSSAAMTDDIYQALVDNHERFFSALDTTEHATLADFLGRLG